MPTTPPSGTPGFIGVDVETTGLDHDQDIILEIGIMILTNELQPLTAKSWLTAQPGHVDRSTLDPVVDEMHEVSGLWADINQGTGISLKNAENEAAGFLLSWNAENLPMLGSSVTFDRRFLARDTPRLHNLLHHRSLDATAVRLARLATTHPQQRDLLDEALTRRAGQLRDSMLTTLDISDELRRPHRPIYDLCASTALTHTYINPDKHQEQPETPQ